VARLLVKTESGRLYLQMSKCSKVYTGILGMSGGREQPMLSNVASIRQKTDYGYELYEIHGGWKMSGFNSQMIFWRQVVQKLKYI